MRRSREEGKLAKKEGGREARERGRDRYGAVPEAVGSKREGGRERPKERK